MANCLHQLYHRYDRCEYFQLKIEFSVVYGHPNHSATEQSSL